MKRLSLAILSTFFLISGACSATLTSEVQNNALVVYNNGIGLVHEQRLLDLKKTDTSLIYEGVANTIDTDSVNLKLPSSIELNSQQFRFDKLTLEKLLDAHINKNIEVKIKNDPNSFTTIPATLLSSNVNIALVKTANSKIISVETKNIIFKDIPKELITKPSLVWNIKTKSDIKSDLEIDYLIRDISWKGDYILNLMQESAQLNGWMSIDNRSGKAFQSTKLNVLAGDINLEHQNFQKKEIAYARMVAEAPQVEHQAHEGYHIYSVPFKVDLANNEKTQIKFIDKPKLAIRRSYSARLNNPLYINGQRDFDVIQYVNLEGVDIALPKGIVRVYSKLGQQNILLAQTVLSHTPKNTPIKLKLGKNFDLKIMQTVLEKADNKFQLNTTLEYEVKNSSDEEKIVRLEIPFNSHKDSKIKTKTPYTLEKGNLVVFHLKISPQNSQKIRANFISKR